MNNYFSFLQKKDISILVGNVLDRYDTSLYGFLAPVMGPLFFPQYDPVVQLILSYATSATSLFSRPIGTFLFGMIARNYGPAFGLSYSLMGVAITTMCIGCIPGYALIGWWAPMVLVCIRLIRGVCAAGESTIAKLYIVENKSERDALKASHLYQSSSMLGIMCASAVSTLIITVQPQAWRFCFWLGGITGLVGYVLRRTVVPQKKRNNDDIYALYNFSSMRLLWHNKLNVMRVALVTCFSHVTYAVPFVFMNSFIPCITTISLPTMMALNTSLLVFDMMMIPLLGHMVMRYNATQVMVCVSMVLGCTIVPLFCGLPHASLCYVTFVRVWIVVWGLLFLCPLNVWYKQLFNSVDQYFLVGMGNAIGVATLGHMTTPICLWLWYVTGVAYAPAVYMAWLLLVTAYAVQTAKVGEEIFIMGDQLEV
jgi:MFS family permease